MEEMRNFKRKILEQITTYAEGLPDYIIDPLLDTIAASIDNIEVFILNNKEKLNRKLQ